MVYFEHIKLEHELLVKMAATRDVEHDIHVHDLLEINIITENEARYRFNDEEYAGSPGDVFICRPFEAHWIYPKEQDKPCRWIMLLFSPSVLRSVPGGYGLLSPFYMSRPLSAHIPAGSSQAQAMLGAARQALEASENRPVAWQYKQFAFFLETMIALYEYTVEHLQVAGFEVMDSGIIQAIGYIISHITEELDMDSVIGISGLGRTLFYRKFRQLTQLSPNHFINRLRLQIAARSLEYTDIPVTAVSLESGFATLSAFNKQFAQFYGMPPRSYRKLKKGDASPEG